MTKYAVVLCDGMADLPHESLGGKTPMELAHKPNMDTLARHGEVGLVRTVAPGMKPGSDVANLAVLGYDASQCYTGRSPLEAVSMGLTLSDTDVAIRCNLVTLSDEPEYENRTMVDYCAGDISTQEAAQLIAAVNDALGSEIFSFNPGVSYRHCLIWHGGTTDIGFLTPPHDISGRVVGEYLDSHPNAAVLIELMKKSVEVLRDHPVNLERIAQGKRPANSIWLWGEGTRPQLELFRDKFGLSGAVVSAVDLIRGIGACADMRVCEVEGATGYIDTCFEKKTQAALDALADGCDLAYLHFEAPDECGHRGEAENKVKSIEYIDSRVLTPLLEGLRKYDSYCIMILPDHPTPLSTMTHSSEPVPYLLYRSDSETDNGIECFTEKTAASTGIFIEKGYTLMNRFIGK